jgi:hypothetical protein
VQFNMNNNNIVCADKMIKFDPAKSEWEMNQIERSRFHTPFLGLLC